MTEWQDISTAPKDGTRILLTDGKWVEAGCWAPALHGENYPWAFVDDFTPLDSADCLGVNVNAFDGRYVTHWQPLPPPPTTLADSDGDGA